MNRPPPWSSLRARSELARWAVSAIFEKWPFVIKPYFLLFEARISCVCLIFLLRSIKAYLCPNMINFDAVDFSERRPEEVISFFWRSVYFDDSSHNHGVSYWTLLLRILTTIHAFNCKHFATSFDPSDQKCRRSSCCYGNGPKIKIATSPVICRVRLVIPNTQISYTWRFVNPKIK